MTDESARMLGDRYQIGDVIGRGGMAEVHEGRDLRLGRRIAVKILRPDLARDPSFQARFRREAQSAAALNHPNIVAVYDTGEDTLAATDTSPAVIVPYIVMEYVDGMTLRQLLASGRRLLPERALEITAGVLSALDYAHRHGIVHRDIKPANVMLTRTGDVKVMDFGIARAINEAQSSMTGTSAVMGTAQYLSPEQARGEVVDARSDLYSTGVLLFELLTGRPPFTGDSAVAIAYQHVSEMPTPPSQIDNGVSLDVDAVVMHSLAKRADDRYQSAAEFRAAVNRCIAGSPMTAPVQTISLGQTQAMPLIEAAGLSGHDRARRSAQGNSNVRGRGIGFWAVSGLAVIAAIVGAVVISQFLFGGGGGKRVQVPNLDGLTVQAASTVLAELGLQLGAQTPELSDRPDGTIIAQQPAFGEMLEQGQAINVTVSGGQEQATVPQLVGLTSIESARLALSDANLQLGEIKQKDSEQPPGYVLDQDPAEGSAVDAGTAVSITISTGNLVVPDLIGASEEQARSDIVQAGFTVQVVYQESADFIEGTVIDQAPLPGGQLARGALVTITVVTAPLPVTPTTGPGPDDFAPAPQPTAPVVPTPEPTPVPTPVASP
ncbi:MAG: Stk1 family PASTA domain-containing Ser/Thr kinase [Actinobacteria bacterium]|nr:Stk1 family PASTA domain-containing Ser/Thr kinase [Actinomycetota bacterium]